MLSFSFIFSQDRAVDGLNNLAKKAVSTSVLAETQAGKRVRTLTKHKEPKISEAAAKVVFNWKDLVRRESLGGSQASLATTSGPPSRVPSSAAIQPSTSGAVQPSELSQQPSGAMSQGTAQGPQASVADIDIADIPSTGDTLRDKIRANLVTALHKAMSEGAETDSSAIDIGVAIELALHAAHNGVSAGYKAKFRQLHFNLKDEKNPDLRRRVMEGVFTPDVLITLPPEELASDAKREENDKIREKKLFDAAPSSAKVATTDQFQCGRCKQRKCTYYQMQTRSADEPMTTFVRCSNCGKAWKFCTIILYCMRNLPLATQLMHVSNIYSTSELLSQAEQVSENQQFVFQN